MVRVGVAAPTPPAADCTRCAVGVRLQSGWPTARGWRYMPLSCAAPLPGRAQVEMLSAQPVRCPITLDERPFRPQVGRPGCQAPLYMRPQPRRRPQGTAERRAGCTAALHCLLIQGAPDSAPGIPRCRSRPAATCSPSQPSWGTWSATAARSCAKARPALSATPRSASASAAVPAAGASADAVPAAVPAAGAAPVQQWKGPAEASHAESRAGACLGMPPVRPAQLHSLPASTAVACPPASLPASCCRRLRLVSCAWCRCTTWRPQLLASPPPSSCCAALGTPSSHRSWAARHQAPLRLRQALAWRQGVQGAAPPLRPTAFASLSSWAMPHRCLWPRRSAWRSTRRRWAD